MKREALELANYFRFRPCGVLGNPVRPTRPGHAAQVTAGTTVIGWFGGLGLAGVVLLWVDPKGWLLVPLFAILPGGILLGGYLVTRMAGRRWIAAVGIRPADGCCWASRVAAGPVPGHLHS